MTNRIKLTLEYDGGRFHGWQRQNGQSSVQETLEQGLTSLLGGEHLQIVGAGRTDSGVHATGQVAHFDLPQESSLSASSPDKLRRGIEAKVLCQGIGVREAKLENPDFHARFSAKSKLYRYTIDNRTSYPALEHKYVWHVPQKLDLVSMRKAARNLVGKHNFLSFSNKRHINFCPYRHLTRVHITTDKIGKIFIDIEGDSFLYKQVRIMVGTLVEIGLGRYSWRRMGEILASQERMQAGVTAPPQGLCLRRVDY